MKKVLLSLSILALSLSAFADPTKAVQKQLEANYALFAKAWQKRDLEPTFKLMTDDFTAVGMNPGGKAIGRADMIAQTKLLLAADHITWPRKVVSVNVKGSEAIAVVDGHFTGMMADKKGEKPHKFELIAETRDTWVLIGKNWKFKRMEVLSSARKMDGKALK